MKAHKKSGVSPSSSDRIKSPLLNNAPPLNKDSDGASQYMQRNKPLPIKKLKEEYDESKESN